MLASSSNPIRKYVRSSGPNIVRSLPKYTFKKTNEINFCLSGSGGNMAKDSERMRVSILGAVDYLF